jgi:hypothetical protein
MSNATTTNAIASAEAMLRQCERDIRGAAALLPDGVPEETYPFPMQANLVRGAAVAKMWRSEGRQTLAVHPEVVHEVSRASSSKFPMEILRTIPYINPMVVFSDQPVMESWRKGAAPERWAKYSGEATMRLMGFMLFGKRIDARTRAGSRTMGEGLQSVINDVTNTHDPAAVSIGILTFFHIYDSAGKKVDVEVASLSVPTTGIYTLKELVQEQAMRFAFSANQAVGVDDARLKWFDEVYRVVMGTILYLCSTTLDAERVPNIATKHLTKTIARKPLSLYRIGWTLGAALTKYRQSIPKGPGSQMGDIRHQQDPQHRKCHFRMQWYGPRDAPACELMRGTCKCASRHREWIFIAPYWTHRERLGMAGINTVRRVPKTG